MALVTMSHVLQKETTNPPNNAIAQLTSTVLAGFVSGVFSWPPTGT